jgi:beta-lactamase regulating signal transducer with metallopeptidase domain
MLVEIVNHLWQSTLFAAGVAVLTVMLRRSPAKYRYWLWLSACVKFLVPFAWLENIGQQFRYSGLPHISSEAAQRILPAVRAIRIGSDPATRLSLPREHWDWLIAAVWAAGLLVLVVLWVARWRQIRQVVSEATELPGMAGVPVRSSSSSLEPGVIGFLNPVVVFPSAILDRLTGPEFAALLEHEKAHLKRRDNLLSVLQMAVEGLFWFYPLVWWLGAKLIIEREQACDQHVLAAGHDPRTYAEAILKVCRLCLSSPIACAAGVSGNILKVRLRKIIVEQTHGPLNRPHKTLLACAAAAILVGPIIAGWVTPQYSSPVIAHIAIRSAPLLKAVVAIAKPNAAIPVADHRITWRAHHVTPGFVTVTLRRDAQSTVLDPLLVSLPGLPLIERPRVSPASEPASPKRDASRFDVFQEKSPTVVTPLDNPTGGGDPAAITCRAPQQLPGSRFFGPKICAPNSRWSSLARQQLHYSAAGEVEASGVESVPAQEGVHLTYINCNSTKLTSAYNSPGCTISPWAAISYY